MRTKVVRRCPARPRYRGLSVTPSILPSSHSPSVEWTIPRPSSGAKGCTSAGGTRDECRELLLPCPDSDHLVGGLLHVLRPVQVSHLRRLPAHTGQNSTGRCEASRLPHRPAVHAAIPHTMILRPASRSSRKIRRMPQCGDAPSRRRQVDKPSGQDASCCLRCESGECLRRRRLAPQWRRRTR